MNLKIEEKVKSIEEVNSGEKKSSTLASDSKTMLYLAKKRRKSAAFKSAEEKEKRLGERKNGEDQYLTLRC